MTVHILVENTVFLLAVDAAVVDAGVVHAFAKGKAGRGGYVGCEMWNVDGGLGVMKYERVST